MTQKPKIKPLCLLSHHPKRRSQQGSRSSWSNLFCLANQATRIEYPKVGGSKKDPTQR